MADLERESEQWVARFAPLILNDKPLSAEQLRARLDSIEQLRVSGKQLWSQVEASPDVREELKTTLMSALEQLPSIRYDLLDALENQRQGHPLNLDKLQDTLAEREARQEMEVATSVVPNVYTAETSFGKTSSVFGWLFTLFVAAFVMFRSCSDEASAAQKLPTNEMIPVWFAVLIVIALLVLAAQTWRGCVNEEVRIEDNTLYIRRYFGLYDSTKQYKLGPDSRVVDISFQQGHETVNALRITVANGSVVKFAHYATSISRRIEIMNEMNNHITHPAI
ncbi:MAG: hypothetical protein JNJ45_01025 [Chthonomonas sp.]|nr:hypothetical protein [Chthonomonas sp.]